MNVRMFGIPTPPLDLVLAAPHDLQHIIRQQPPQRLLSVRLAEQGCEGQHENLVAVLIDDMQGPIAPIFQTG